MVGVVGVGRWAWGVGVVGVGGRVAIVTKKLKKMVVPTRAGYGILLTFTVWGIMLD